jgi:hypothetical protein
MKKTINTEDQQDLNSPEKEKVESNKIEGMEFKSKFDKDFEYLMRVAKGELKPEKKKVVKKE